MSSSTGVSRVSETTFSGPAGAYYATGFEAGRKAAQERIAELEGALQSMLALIEANERQPMRNMAGAMVDFCPVCRGTPSIHALNPSDSTPDGHWLKGPFSGDGGCLLWQLRERVRAALAGSKGGGLAG